MHALLQFCMFNNKYWHLSVRPTTRQTIITNPQTTLPGSSTSGRSSLAVSSTTSVTVTSRTVVSQTSRPSRKISTPSKRPTVISPVITTHTNARVATTNVVNINGQQQSDIQTTGNCFDCTYLCPWPVSSYHYSNAFLRTNLKHWWVNENHLVYN